MAINTQSFLKSIKKGVSLYTGIPYGRSIKKTTKTKFTKPKMTEDIRPSLKAMDEMGRYEIKKAGEKLSKAKERAKIERTFKGLPSVKIGTKTDMKKAEQEYEKRVKEIKKIREWEYNKRRMSPTDL